MGTSHKLFIDTGFPLIGLAKSRRDSDDRGSAHRCGVTHLRSGDVDRLASGGRRSHAGRNASSQGYRKEFHLGVTNIKASIENVFVWQVCKLKNLCDQM